MSSPEPKSSRSTTAAVLDDRGAESVTPAADAWGLDISETRSSPDVSQTAGGDRGETADAPTGLPHGPSADSKPPHLETDASSLSWWRRRGRRTSAAFTASLFAHAAILLVLSLWITVNHVVSKRVLPLQMDTMPQVAEDEFTAWVTVPNQSGNRQVRPQLPAPLPPGDVALQVASPAIPFPERELKQTAHWIIGPPRKDWLPRRNWLSSTGAADGGGLEGRSPESREQLLSAYGGTQASEEAVQLGLKWLASAQLDDGSWRFNHEAGPLRGKCRNPGSVGTTTGATALALLSFLGVGVTLETEGEYGDTLLKGLNYLLIRRQITPDGSDLQEGTMYAQGLATLALCEAYAMNGDPLLKEAAQDAIDFICHAQNEEGGWRYFPGQRGDMTVTGWQLMALKSGQMAKLDVPPEAIVRAIGFLNRVQSDDGAYYGYMGPDRSPTSTSIGLLMRMYTGWSRHDERLERGAAYVAQTGPSRHDLYFNYYATQLLHHHESPYWDAWNQQLRQRLIETQATEGAERGSWYFSDPHGTPGGRHYSTAMAIMILEVYYRYMPLYTETSVGKSLPGPVDASSSGN